MGSPIHMHGVKAHKADSQLNWGSWPHILGGTWDDSLRHCGGGLRSWSGSLAWTLDSLSTKRKLQRI